MFKIYSIRVSAKNSFWEFEDEIRDPEVGLKKGLFRCQHAVYQRRIKEGRKSGFSPVYPALRSPRFRDTTLLVKLTLKL